MEDEEVRIVGNHPFEQRPVLRQRPPDRIANRLIDRAWFRDRFAPCHAWADTVTGTRATPTRLTALRISFSPLLAWAGA